MGLFKQPFIGSKAARLAGESVPFQKHARQPCRVGNAPRRELVHVVLRDTCAPTASHDWMDCVVLAVTVAMARPLHVQLVVRQA